MNDIAIITNALMYSILFIRTFMMNKKLGTSEVLLFIYVVVSIAGLFHYYAEPYIWQLSLFNFAYLFISFFIFYKPVMCDRTVEVKANPLSNPNLYKKIAIVYIIIALYSCVVYIPQVYLILQNPDWAELYADAHEEQESNIFIKIANLFFHFRFLGIVLFFVFLAQKNSNKVFLFILGVASFLPIVLVTLKNASRGGIVALVVSVYLAFRMFDQILSTKIKDTIKRIGFCLIPIVALYFIAVTVSRFDDNAGTGYDSSESALVSYLGHSMLKFNYGVMDTTTSYAWGGYMFDNKDLLKNIRGGHYGTDFITFVGTLYLDYGPIGTILVALLASFFIKKFLKKRDRGIPELFIILYYLMYLFNGVFVNGLGYGNQWLETIFIYIMLKFAEKLFKSKRVNYV